MVLRDIMIFIQFVCNPLPHMTLMRLFTGNGFEGVGFERSPLSRKADTTHHAQGIVRKK